jgi:hypothetical protein
MAVVQVFAGARPPIDGTRLGFQVGRFASVAEEMLGRIFRLSAAGCGPSRWRNLRGHQRPADQPDHTCIRSTSDRYPSIDG